MQVKESKTAIARKEVAGEYTITLVVWVPESGPAAAAITSATCLKRRSSLCSLQHQQGGAVLFVKQFMDWQSMTATGLPVPVNVKQVAAHANPALLRGHGLHLQAVGEGGQTGMPLKRHIRSVAAG